MISQQFGKRAEEPAASRRVHMDMKLLAGASSYIAVVGIVAAAAIAGLSALTPDGSHSSPAAKATDGIAARSAANVDVIKDDPDRVPVWIVATPKYEYTPVPIDAHPKRMGAALEARRINAQGIDPRRDGRRAIEAATRSQSDMNGGRRLGFAASRDNDPFFRD